jgi:hypothetical protein
MVKQKGPEVQLTRSQPGEFVEYFHHPKEWVIDRLRDIWVVIDDPTLIRQAKAVEFEYYGALAQLESNIKLKEAEMYKEIANLLKGKIQG